MTQWMKTNHQSLTYIRPPRTLSNLYGDFVQIRKEVVLSCSGLKSCILVEGTFAAPLLPGHMISA